MLDLNKEIREEDEAPRELKEIEHWMSTTDALVIQNAFDEIAERLDAYGGKAVVTLEHKKSNDGSRRISISVSSDVVDYELQFKPKYWEHQRS